jgi:hypothetical protein
MKKIESWEATAGGSTFCRAIVVEGESMLNSGCLVQSDPIHGIGHRGL